MVTQGSNTTPLIVDLDGTLIRTDLLHESTIKLMRRKPYLLLMLPLWLFSGKASLKRRIAERTSIDVKSLPYNIRFIAWLKEQRSAGRTLVLCTASDQKYASAVSNHLGIFDDVIASDGKVNMSATQKAEELVERYGETGFDYAGNGHADIIVWARSRRAIVVAATSHVARAARLNALVEREFDREPATLSTWIREMRVYQWLKNLLLFLPMLGAHRMLEPELILDAFQGFFSFGLCASAVYMLNDLMDLESDRRHPRKKSRPFASGQLSLLSGVIVAALLLVGSLLLTSSLPPAFLTWLGAYFTVTLAYSITLKSRVLFDAISLATLFTLRILAGGAAVDITPSFWLLAFSLFLFLSLAFVKRYTELQAMQSEGVDEVPGRGYRTEDLPLVETLGVASGFMAVLVMALYIDGDTVITLYRTPELMWLTIPLLLYWTNRMWIKAHRGEMHDDPIIYALRDHISLICGALFLGVLWAAANLQW